MADSPFPPQHVQHLADAYLDGELELSRALEVEGHLDGCALCRNDLRERRALSGRVRGQAARFAAPPELLAAVERAIRQETGSSSPKVLAPRVWRRKIALYPVLQAAAGLAVAALLGSSLTWVALRPSQDPAQQAAAQAASGHLRSLLAEGHLIDVASSDEHTVKPWFNGKLDFAPPVVDLTAQGFRLVGGRLDYLQDQVVAGLVYRHRQHVVTVYIWPQKKGAGPQPAAAPAAGGTTPALVAETQRGLNLMHWTSGGMTFWAVSDLNAADLGRLCALLRQSES